MSVTDFDGCEIEKALLEEGEITVCTSGISMYPMLRHRRDTVVIKKPDREPKKHDVVLYRAESGKLILHRVIKLRPDCLVIRGDNLLNLEYVKKERIIGVLKEFYRGGRYCNCETSRKYRIYIILNRASYPARKLWRLRLRPFLGKIKRKVVKIGSR